MAERMRGWTGVVEPHAAFLVIENGLITDVIYADGK